jgi:adenylyl- and sulfurtransferase ThiI
VLKDLDPELAVDGVWDNLEVVTRIEDEKVQREMIERLTCTPGITHFLQVQEYPLGDFDDIVEKCKQHFGHLLAGKYFACAASVAASTTSPRWTSTVTSAASCASNAARPASS